LWHRPIQGWPPQILLCSCRLFEWALGMPQIPVLIFNVCFIWSLIKNMCWYIIVGVGMVQSSPMKKRTTGHVDHTMIFLCLYLRLGSVTIVCADFVIIALAHHTCDIYCELSCASALIGDYAQSCLSHHPRLHAPQVMDWLEMKYCNFTPIVPNEDAV
jgi:hypothetical protein